MNEQRDTVAFVGGVGRSGSTLIELALGQMPAACPLGEVVHLWQRGLIEDQRCGCGSPFSQCAFWTAVGEHAFGGWRSVDPQAVLRLKAAVDRTRFVPRLLGPDGDSAFSRNVREHNAIYQKIYAAARAVSGKSLVIDSSKHVSTVACLSRSGELDLRVVHVVRHPLGVAHSWSKVKVRPEITSHQEFMPQYSPAQVGAQYDSRNLMFEMLKLRGRRPQMLVRYEDFAARPAGVLREIAAFLQVEPQPEWVAEPQLRTVELGVQHTVAGNPLRFTQGPVEIRQDEGWRTGLDSRARNTVLAMTLPLRYRYGYLGG